MTHARFWSSPRRRAPDLVSALAGTRPRKAAARSSASRLDTTACPPAPTPSWRRCATPTTTPSRFTSSRARSRADRSCSRSWTPRRRPASRRWRRRCARRRCADLQKVLAEIQGAVDAAVAAGEEPSVLIFYSGHGGRADDGQAALTLVGRAADQGRALRDRAGAAAGTVFVHLFVDACNAEAVVRPARRARPGRRADRGRRQRRVPEDHPGAGFPRVGALVASTAGRAGARVGRLPGGDLHARVLSALRGAADVDGNHRIEYSEIAAFLSAANRDVGDPRARPDRGPPATARSPRGDRRSGGCHGVCLPRGPGRRDRRLLRRGRARESSARPARRGALPRALAVPADETLYLRTRRPGDRPPRRRGAPVVQQVHLAENDVRGRGALESALRRGLFATGFGRGYYRGFVDSQESWSPCRSPTRTSSSSRPSRPRRTRCPATPRLLDRLRTAGALAVTAGVSAGWPSTHATITRTPTSKAPALDASNRYKRD